MPPTHPPRSEPVAMVRHTTMRHPAEALDKLLRAYREDQVTWEEMQQRFDQLVNVYGSRGATADGPSRAATAGPLSIELPADATGTVTEAVAEMRPIGWDDAMLAPQGWRVAIVLWDGEDHEIFYDPHHVSSVMALPQDAVTPKRRVELAQSGWVHSATDREGTELWIQQPRAAAEARLDALRAPTPDVTQARSVDPPEAPGVGL